MRRLILSIAFLTLSAVAYEAGAQNGPYQYFPLSPCRAVDTRGANGLNNGPILGHGETRNVSMRGHCGVRTTAKAVSLNVTITAASQGSWLAIWPSGLVRPTVSMINFQPSDPALANGIIVGLSTNAQDLSVFNSNGVVHVLLDVTGY